MKERPIIYSPDMASAVYHRRKFQTRRRRGLELINDSGANHWNLEGPAGGTDGRFDFVNFRTDQKLSLRCPYGVPGDRLWSREAHFRTLNNTLYKGEYPRTGHGGPQQCTDEWDWPTGAINRWTPAIHQRRDVSRSLKEIVGVRAQQVNSISPEDAIAEGIDKEPCLARPKAFVYRDYCLRKYDPAEWFASPVRSFESAWNHINGCDAWKRNDWVFAITFKEV